MMGLVQSQKPERKGIVEKPAMFKGDNSDNARLFRNAFVVYMSDNEKYFARDQQGHVLRDANGVPITISECNEESFCQGGAIGDLFPPTLFLDLVVGICLLLRIQKWALIL